MGGLIFDTAGNLYGTFSKHVNGPFELSPSMGGNWTFTALYSQDYGRVSFQSTLARDSAGNLYGASEFGGNSNCDSGCGLVYKLSPSNGGWVYSQLYAFTGAADGAYPIGGIESVPLFKMRFRWSPPISSESDVNSCRISAARTILHALSGVLP